ncbi:MAG: acyl-CoA dehydrogenase family protein [Roseovarius sp.]|nr:acyl-CoA dehydrogenase family protein [Roseovarius sp.]
MGLGASKQLIYVEEFEKFGAARTPDHGMMLLGPLLINYGSEEQKAYFLPRILSGEHIWCRVIPSPTRAPISPACAPKRCSTAMNGW